MGKRNTGRKLAMQAVYQAEIRQKDITDILNLFMENTSFGEETKEWTSHLALPTWQRRNEIDQIIIKYSVDWSIERIQAVDRSILRIAIFELLYTDTPVNVVLDEAIEIAKRYSTDDSPKFINGILGHFVQAECSRV